MSKYSPRRASKKRWLQDAPEYVLDCFDDPRTIDRYTVMFAPPVSESDGTFAGTHIAGLAMSGAPSPPQGFSQWFELRAWQAVNYRYRNKRYRVRWLDLPENIRQHVVMRALWRTSR